MNYREPVAMLIKSMSEAVIDWHISMHDGCLVGVLHKEDNVVTVYSDTNKTEIEAGVVSDTNRVVIESDIGGYSEKTSILHLNTDEALVVHDILSTLFKNVTDYNDKQALRYLREVFDPD